MFALTKQEAKFSYFNTRTENAGDTPVGAADIGLAFQTKSEFLESVAKGLRGLIYKKPATQGELVDGAAPDEGPTLRFGDMLNKIHLNKDYPGYAVRLVWGDLASSLSVKIDDVRVRKINVSPMEGGTINVSLQVQSHPSPEQMGDLFQMLGRDVTVCLVGPGVDFV